MFRLFRELDLAYSGNWGLESSRIPSPHVLWGTVRACFFPETTWTYRAGIGIVVNNVYVTYYIYWVVVSDCSGVSVWTNRGRASDGNRVICGAVVCRR